MLPFADCLSNLSTNIVVRPICRGLVVVGCSISLGTIGIAVYRSSVAHMLHICMRPMLYHDVPRYLGVSLDDLVGLFPRVVRFFPFASFWQFFLRISRYVRQVPWGLFVEGCIFCCFSPFLIRVEILLLQTPILPLSASRFAQPVQGFLLSLAC